MSEWENGWMTEWVSTQFVYIKIEGYIDRETLRSEVQ